MKPSDHAKVSRERILMHFHAHAISYGNRHTASLVDGSTVESVPMVSLSSWWSRGPEGREVEVEEEEEEEEEKKEKEK